MAVAAGVGETGSAAGVGVGVAVVPGVGESGSAAGVGVGMAVAAVPNTSTT